MVKSAERSGRRVYLRRLPHIKLKEILEAVKDVLKKGKTIRVLRQITDSWTLEELQRYEEVIKAGSQVRYLSAKEIPIRYTVFDDRDIILVLPLKLKSTVVPQAIEALWLRIPPLAKVLEEHFEELWEKGKPMLPILKQLKEKKLQEKRT